jgi:hypothetical protein
MKYETWQYVVHIHRELVSTVINGNIDILKEYIENTPPDEDAHFVEEIGKHVEGILFEKINRMREK